MAVDLKSISESIDKTLEIIHAVREIYSHHEVLFQKVAPEVYKAFHNFAKEYDHDMSHILLQDLEEDYEQDVEIPTHILFHSIEHFFHHPSQSSLDDMKAICNQNRVIKLLDLQYYLNKADSIYFKYLELLNFKSKYANILMNKFEGTAVKLVIAYEVCQTFTTTDRRKTTKHVKETVIAIIKSIREQRKNIPNLITADAILRHLNDFHVPHYFVKDALDWGYSYIQGGKCSDKPTGMSRDCTLKCKMCTDQVLKDTFTGRTRMKPMDAIEKISDYVSTDLTENYNYGKIWTIYISLDSLIGKKEGNVVEYEIGPLTILIYFSNPPKTPVRIPLEEIEENLVSRTLNFFEMFRFWDHLCPYVWESEGDLAERFYNKFKYNNYCGSRSLCVVGTAKYIYSSKSNNTDLNFVTPCVSRDFISILMGPEEGQEERYPPGDKFDMKDPFKWSNNLEEKIKSLRKEYNQEIEL